MHKSVYLYKIFEISFNTQRTPPRSPKLELQDIPYLIANCTTKYIKIATLHCSRTFYQTVYVAVSLHNNPTYILAGLKIIKAIATEGVVSQRSTRRIFISRSDTSALHKCHSVIGALYGIYLFWYKRESDITSGAACNRRQLWESVCI